MSEPLPNLKGYRTVLFNAAASIAPLLMVIADLLTIPELKAVLPIDWLPYYALALTLLNMGLRKITSTPIGRRA